MRKLYLLHLLITGCLIYTSPAIAQHYGDSLRIHHEQYDRSNRNDTSKLIMYVRISNDYRRNNYDSSLFYARQALLLARKIKYKYGESWALSDLEFGLRETGDLAEALNIQLQALDLARDLKNRDIEAQELNSIGNTYLEMGDPKIGLAYYKASLKVFRERKDNYWILNEQSNMGNAFEKMNMLDSALYYENMMRSRKDFPADIIPELMGRLGNVYVKLGKSQKALDYYRNGLKASKDVFTVSDDAINYYQMAKLYKSLDQPDSAIIFGRRSYFTAKKISLRKILLYSSELLADLYSTHTSLDSAFHYERLAVRYNDTLFGADKFSQIQHILSNEQQRQEKIVQEKERQTNSYRMIAGAAMIAAVLLVLLLIWRNNYVQKRKNQLLNIQKTQLTEQRDEMQITLADLNKTQTQLIQSEKMASLGELTAGIAHEIQNPLNFVNNFSEVNIELLDEMELELNSGDKDEAISIASDIRQNLEKIRHHGKRADGIVKGMLQHSRASSNTKEPVNINNLADEYLRLAYHGLRAKDKSFNAELETKFDSTLPNISVVPQDIGRVLLNLFTNAFYAVNQKTKTAGASYKPTITVSTISSPLASGDPGVCITVKDNGNGIPDAIKDKVMQPFFTSKPTGEGTGLGLSLSYDIITKGHGGKIELNSKEREFTVFTITLPIT